MEDCKLRDYEGNYEEFLEKNEDEAEKMAVKEERVKEIEKVGLPCRRFMVYRNVTASLSCCVPHLRSTSFMGQRSPSNYELALLSDVRLTWVYYVTAWAVPAPLSLQPAVSQDG